MEPSRTWSKPYIASPPPHGSAAARSPRRTGSTSTSAGEGETGGTVNARYGRDPIIKLYTHISDRYAPFHVKVITGTSGEAIHVLDGLVNHDSAIDILAHHTDGGGLNDHVFAIMYLLGMPTVELLE